MRKILKENNFIKNIIGVESIKKDNFIIDKIDDVDDTINVIDDVDNISFNIFDVTEMVSNKIEESVFENISSVILNGNKAIEVTEALEFNKVNLTFISNNLNSLTFIIYFNIFLQIVLLAFIALLYFTCLKSTNLPTTLLKRINSKYQV